MLRLHKLAKIRCMTPVPKSKDRRAARRYGVKTPFRFRFSNGTPTGGWKSGRTLDMSARGILIETEEQLSLGNRLDLSMDWPGLYHGKEMMRLYVSAVVVRVDERSAALRILSHKFRDVPP